MVTNLILLHYFGGNRNSWQWLLPYLPKNMNVHTLDLPGFGEEPGFKEPTIEKMAGYIQKYISENNLKNCVLVGHSMSGKIALYTAFLNKNSSIDQLILVAPSPPTIEEKPNSEIKRMLTRSQEEAKNTVENSIIKPISSAQKKFATQSQLQIDDTTWRWWLEKGMKHSIKSQLNTLLLPISLIYSEDDPAITSTMVEDEILPNLNFKKIIRTKNIGHLMPIENPKWLSKQLVNCLEKND